MHLCGIEIFSRGCYCSASLVNKPSSASVHVERGWGCSAATGRPSTRLGGVVSKDALRGTVLSVRTVEWSF